jgi:hypothetical protein
MNLKDVDCNRVKYRDSKGEEITIKKAASAAF